MPHTTQHRGRATALSATEVQAFFEVGWITRRALFERDEVTAMRACFDELERIAGGMTETGFERGSYFVLGTKAGRQVIKRVVWAGGSQRYLLEVGNDPRLTVPSAQLLHSAALDHLLSQAHFKHPHDGVVFDWHQDITHRDKGNGTWRDVNGRGSYVQTLIALDEMTPDSGPLLFIPGSPQCGRLEFNGHAAHAAGDPDSLPAPLRASRAVTIEAQPGDTLFFGPYAAHASFENTSAHSRRVLINGYAHPGANRRLYPGSGTGRRLIAPTLGMHA